MRCDFQRVFDTGYFAILPNFELLRTIYDEVMAHRHLPYSRRPKWTEVRSLSPHRRTDVSHFAIAALQASNSGLPIYSYALLYSARPPFCPSSSSSFLELCRIFSAVHRRTASSMSYPPLPRYIQRRDQTESIPNWATPTMLPAVHRLGSRNLELLDDGKRS